MWSSQTHISEYNHIYVFCNSRSFWKLHICVYDHIYVHNLSTYMCAYTHIWFKERTYNYQNATSMWHTRSNTSVWTPYTLQLYAHYMLQTYALSYMSIICDNYTRANICPRAYTYMWHVFQHITRQNRCIVVTYSGMKFTNMCFACHVYVENTFFAPYWWTILCSQPYENSQKWVNFQKSTNNFMSNHG